MSYLLDTNVISELIRTKPNLKVVNWIKSVPDDSLFVSVLSFGEIRKGIEKLPETKKKEKLRVWFEHELVSWFGKRVLSIDQVVADRWGRLLASEHRPLAAIDSLIAATALHFDLALVTRNENNFQYQSLEIINPWKVG